MLHSRSADPLDSQILKINYAVAAIYIFLFVGPLSFGLSAALMFLWAVADVKTKFSGTIRAHATYGLEGRGRDGDAETDPGAGIKTPFCRGMRAKYLIL